MSETNIIYEFAYHLSPDFDEQIIKEKVISLRDFIIQNRGTIVKEKDPIRKHLSYPIAHNHYGQFGTINFECDSSFIEIFNSHIKLQDGILRYIITKKPIGPSTRTLGEVAPNIRSNIAPTHTKEDMESASKKSPDDQIKMEKDIEGVLDKI